MDTYSGDLQSPASLHKFLYANADSVNNTDPRGRFSLPEVIAGSFAVLAIAAITYLYFNPVREKFGLIWRSDIDWSTGLCKGADEGPGCSFNSDQINVIKSQALQTLHLAYLDFFVKVQEGVLGAHSAVVDNRVLRT